MMQLENLTIKQKLFIPIVLVVFGFLTIFIVFQYQTSVMKKADVELEVARVFYNNLGELHEQIRQNIIFEKNLLLKADEGLVSEINDGLNTVDTLLAQLVNEGLTDNSKIKVQDQKIALNVYTTTLKQIVESKIKLGFTEDEGIRGEVRQSIHAIEAIVAKEGDIYLSHSMLMMRRHEKDFLARHNDKYVQKMDVENKHFLDILKKSKLIPKSEKTVVQNLLLQYQNSFFIMVEEEKKLMRLVAGGEDAILNMEASMKNLVVAHAEERGKAQIHFEQSMKDIDIIFYVALLLTGMIAILILWRLAHSVTKALDLLIRSMRDLADGSGDLSRRIEISGSDETAILSGLVNSMMDNLATLIGKVQESGIQVASTVTQITASTREQEATATEYASTTHEVAASVKEISSTSKKLGQTTQEVNELAQGTARSASDAQVLLANLDATMSRMSKASNVIAEKLALLNEKASNIGEMVTTINKVADQTNLLSLNAAIEAEKAGEYGRGFAVVAREIRRLADQTAVATFDIEQMVGEVQSAISSGVMGMDKFSEEIDSSVKEAKTAGLQMEQTIDQVQALAPHIESVNEGLQAQVEGASMIDEAMMDLAEAAQQTAEFVRQSNSAIAELNNAARNLQEGASQFKVSS